jgi:hypothetical protein
VLSTTVRRILPRCIAHTDSGLLGGIENEDRRYTESTAHLQTDDLSSRNVRYGYMHSSNI